MFCAVLLCACGTALPGQELTFSHRLHFVEANTTCLDCHAPARESKAAADILVPTEDQCAVCHEGGTATPVDTAGLKNFKTKPRSYRFNHEFHLRLGNAAPLIAAAIDSGRISANPATRGSISIPAIPARRATGCREADMANEAHLPLMPDCLVCHSEVDNPFSCEKCHLEGVNLRPADHTRDFIDLHSTGKISYDKQTCLPCHAATSVAWGVTSRCLHQCLYSWTRRTKVEMKPEYRAKRQTYHERIL